MKTIALLVICTLPAACTTWRAASLEPAHFSAEKSPREVRLTLNDSTRVKVQYPELVGDSLVWMDAPSRSRPDSVRRTVPVSGIRRVEVHQVDGGATVLLLLLIGGTVGGFLIWASSLGGD